MDKNIIIVAVGAILVGLSVFFEGLGIAGHTLDHVYKDLTEDIFPHLFILGIAFIAYGIFRSISKG